jgi:uncharacterized protein YigE (DUF2233 family)
MVKMGQPKINADQKGRRWRGGSGVCQSGEVGQVRWPTSGQAIS